MVRRPNFLDISRLKQTQICEAKLINSLNQRNHSTLTVRPNGIPAQQLNGL